jgi:uncharacterized LabA/DUF88 family protein
MTRIRKIAVLIDGGFLVKRLKNWPNIDHTDAKEVATISRWMARRHVHRLTASGRKVQHSFWLDHVYRLFFYDAHPYEDQPHHPLKNRQINYRTTLEAEFRRDLFRRIRRQRKFALRLGTLNKAGYWSPYNRHMKGLLKLWHHADYLDALLADPANADPEKSLAARQALTAWKELKEDDIELPLRQKGVDMRIGLDIASMTFKRQVDTIILVTGDSDFIPAAKIARREGVEFILDPLWQRVSDDLREHVDGIASGLGHPRRKDVEAEA